MIRTLVIAALIVLAAFLPLALAEAVALFEIAFLLVGVETLVIAGAPATARVAALPSRAPPSR